MIVAFAAGYVPKHLEAQRATTSLEAARADLLLADLHRQLGVAANEAQLENYPAAATAAHVFFEGCRKALEEPSIAELPRTRIALTSYADAAPQMLQSLALRDASTKARLASLYLTMHGVIERRL